MRYARQTFADQTLGRNNHVESITPGYFIGRRQMRESGQVGVKEATRRPATGL
jgi:hypothetical protein